MESSESRLTDTTEQKFPSYSINFGSIYDEEDGDNFIYSIREKIMSNVMNEIDRIDVICRTITFTVDIACEALWRTLNVEFIQHTELPNILNPVWKGDACFQPSHRDSLAAKTVPIAPKSKMIEEETTIVGDGVCTCQLKVVCECLKSANQREKVYIELLEDQGVVAGEEEKVIEDEIAALNMIDGDTEKELTLSQASESIVETNILKSVPSLVVSDSSTTDSVPRVLKCVLSEGFSKLNERKRQSILPKLNVTKYGKVQSLTRLLELPAIRGSIKSEVRPEEPPDDKKNKKKNKPKTN